MDYVIIETQKGEEVIAWECYSYKFACACMCDYSEEDKETLSPCIYKRFSDGTVTTDF